MSQHPDLRYAIAGAGRMGTALMTGWLRSSRSGVTAHNLIVMDPQLQGGGGDLVEVHDLNHVESLDEDQQSQIDVLILAVKPHLVEEVLRPIADGLKPDALIVSVAAGIPLRIMENLLPDRAIVRVMPNVAGQIGKGVSVAIGNDVAESRQVRPVVDRLMKVLGPIYWIDDERLMGAVTAVSGSGPAYVFLLAEALARAGEAEGLPADLSEKLAVATVAGSGTLLERSFRDETGDAVSLRRSVTSPGGTTQAALDVLMGEGGGLPTLIRNAVSAAERRSRQLASGSR